MKQFYILPNPGKDRTGEVTGEITRYLEDKGSTCRIIRDGSELKDGADCLIVLGGDGTVLRAARRIVRHSTPIIGINLGSLGYLAEVGKDAIFPALEQLLHDDFIIEERMMLEGKVIRKGEVIAAGYALNDLTISRRGPLRVVQFESYINKEPLSRFNADGIILATPTGSTGYSLSAGGPVVSPSASLIIMTPVAAHSINSRSIIFSDKDRIRVVIGEDRLIRPETAAVYFDGEDETMLRNGDAVEAHRAAYTTKIIKLSNISFLEILRHKMQLT
ncbi:MAG: NAD(+)/NADH kinase [Lachnospiraceae bacterium]|nr:NAD(+)/NADH kinase [Lachnospiraceae bacterium]